MATLNLGRIKPVFRGAYSGGTAYVIDDIVTSGGSTYICIQAHGAGTQAVTVTAYWSVLAATGTDVSTTITTQGDILYRDGSGLQRLAKPAANKMLQNTSGGVLSWETPSGGKLLQVVSTHISAASSITTGAHTGGWGAYGTFITCAITPAATSSKKLVLWQIGYDFGSGFSIHLGRDNASGDVEIGLADAASNRNRALFGAHEYEANVINKFSGQYLDSPSIATATTYEMKVSSNSATAGWYLNRSVNDRDDVAGYDTRGSSNLTLMEIGA